MSEIKLEKIIKFKKKKREGKKKFFFEDLICKFIFRIIESIRK
jgi:hypothetical protein